MSSNAKKIAIYVMPDKTAQKHSFMAMRRTTKNAKGRYVTAEQFEGLGLLFGPGRSLQTRDDLALRIGRALLDEIGV